MKRPTWAGALAGLGLLALSRAASAQPAPDAAEPGDAPEVKLGDAVSVRFKPGTGAALSTLDRRFSLTIRTRMQVRYDATIPGAEGEDPEHLLQLRRMRLVFQGNAFGEHNKFYVQLGLAPQDMTNGLLADVGSIRRNPVRDARIELDHLRDATLMLGQMKVPLTRQRVVSSGNLEMVDRAVTNDEFQVDRDVGLQVLSKDLFGWDRLAYHLGVFMGEGRNAFEPRDFGMLWVARLEWLPFGRFDDYSEGDLGRSRRPGLALGAAYAFHDNAEGDRSVHGSRFADRGTADYHHATADVMFKYRGVSAQLAVHYRDGTRTPGDVVDESGAQVPAGLPRNGAGLLVQVGYLLPWVDLQAVGRYATVRNTQPATSSLPDRNEAAVGLGYYFGGHAYKVQIDYSRLWEHPPGGDKAAAFSSGDHRLRAQIQLSL